MRALPIRKFAPSSSVGRGVSCGPEGACIGFVPLLKRARLSGREIWTARDTDQISEELSHQFDLPIDISPRAAALNAIARDLNAGDLAHAQLVKLHLQIPEPPLLVKVASAPERINFIRELFGSGLLGKVWEPEEHPRWPAYAPDSQGGQFAPKDSVFGFETSAESDESENTEIAANTPRVHPRTLRTPWERAEGKVWPRDPKTGRYMDAAHIRALADGGDNNPRNIKPMAHDEHVAEHKAQGDFSRWARLRGSSRQTGSQQRFPTSTSAKPGAAPPKQPQEPSVIDEDTDPMLLDEIPLDEVPIIIPE